MQKAKPKAKKKAFSGFRWVSQGAGGSRVADPSDRQDR